MQVFERITSFVFQTKVLNRVLLDGVLRHIFFLIKCLKCVGIQQALNTKVHTKVCTICSFGYLKARRFRHMLLGIKD